jgi:exopolysaccharide biosynthesis WecB/TagA/CpsF family protein
MKLNDVVHTDVGGLKTACVTRQQLVAIIEAYISNFASNADTPCVIFDSNGHGISLANTDSGFMQTLSQADIIHADGQSVVAMSKWVRGSNIPERSATTDLIHDIPQHSELVKKHYLLGGSTEVVERCADILTKQYKNVNVVGTHHGYFDKAYSDEVIASINASKPDILWVGLGKPLEQEWVIANKDKLKVAVIISCGGCYNYITGDYPRAPLWMQRAGLEWLHRLYSDPKRLFWRYLISNPHSIYCVLKHKFLR